MPPPIELFLTTIASQVGVRKRQEYLLRTLQVKKIEFVSFDLASDEEAKKRWRRKSPPGKYEVPGILVGGSYPGTFAEFEDAAEHDELHIFLRLNDPWNPLIDDDSSSAAPSTPAKQKPIGVPGAYSPSQMNQSHKPSFSPNARLPVTPKDLKKREIEEFDVSTELSGFGLQGVKITNDELMELAKELGLGKEDAGELVHGLGEMDIEDKEESVSALKPSPDVTAPLAGKASLKKENPSSEPEVSSHVTEEVTTPNTLPLAGKGKGSATTSSTILEVGTPPLKTAKESVQSPEVPGDTHDVDETTTLNAPQPGASEPAVSSDPRSSPEDPTLSTTAITDPAPETTDSTTVPLNVSKSEPEPAEATLTDDQATARLNLKNALGKGNINPGSDGHMTLPVEPKAKETE